MDTWATSSMSPQIVGRWQSDPALYNHVFPFTLRPQAHEIIRTWAFDTIVKSLYHFNTLPWSDVGISGWGLAPKGTGKISKSRGNGGLISPDDAFSKYSTDAVRYWAASTGFGKDSIIREEKIKVGQKLVTKLWNVAKFSERFLSRDTPASDRLEARPPTDRWILSRAQKLIARMTELLNGYDYAAAKSEVESFFWTVLADNYLEMIKARLYDEEATGHDSGKATLHQVLLLLVKLFAPFLPHVTEQIYLGMFAAADRAPSIHRSHWPVIDESLLDQRAEDAGDILVEIATAVRRYKSERSLRLGAELPELTIATPDATLADMLRYAALDIRSVTRARLVTVGAVVPPGWTVLPVRGASSVSTALRSETREED